MISFFFLEICGKYDENLRPNIPIKFDEIMAISAKNRGTDIENLKLRLRHLLDFYAEVSESEDVSTTIYDKMSRSVAEKGPKVI